MASKLKKVPITEIESFKSIPREVFLDAINPNDSIVDELKGMDRSQLQEQIIIMYQNERYYQAAISYLKDRITKKQ